MKKSLLLIFCFSLAASAAWSRDLRVMVNNGHMGGINSLIVDERFHLLFTAGEDGTIRSWDPETKKLITLIQVSRNPVVAITLHPQKTQVAAVIKSGMNRFRLAVWDWKEQRELYTRELNEQPLHIDYSPKGTYLVFSKPVWQSLTFLDGKTGRTLPHLERSYGIVSNFIVSPSETTIMTYSPSGKIEYWNIKEETRKTWIETVPDVEHIQFTGNLRFMIGTRKGELLLIDLLSGLVTASLPVGSIHTMRTNHLTNEIACTHTIGRNTHLSVINYIDGTLIPRSVTTLPAFRPTDSAFLMNSIYLADRSGAIRFYPSTIGKESGIMAERTLAALDHLTFHKSKMAFTTEGSLYFIDSDFFAGTEKSGIPDYFEVDIHENTYSKNSYLESAGDDRYLLWDGDNGYLNYINAATGSPEGDTLVLSGPIDKVKVYDETILVLQTNGVIRLLGKNDFKEKFRYNAFGIKTVTLTEEALLFGKSRHTGFNAPLLYVNIETNETVPIFDNSTLVYESVYDQNRSRLYTLALEEHSEGIQTVCKIFYGNMFSFTRRLLSFPGEDLSASIVLNPATSQIFTTLGPGGVKSFSGTRTVEYELKEHVPSKLYVYHNYLYSINRDNSITVWSISSRKKVMDFYFFEDSNWAALLAGGHYYASEGASEYIAVYDGIKPLSGKTAESLKLN